MFFPPPTFYVRIFLRISGRGKKLYCLLRSAATSSRWRAQVVLARGCNCKPKRRTDVPIEGFLLPAHMGDITIMKSNSKPVPFAAIMTELFWAAEHEQSGFNIACCRITALGGRVGWCGGGEVKGGERGWRTCRVHFYAEVH